MEVTMEQLSKLQKKDFSFGDPILKEKLRFAIDDDMKHYREFNLYVSHYEYLPNYDCLEYINCSKANSAFLEKYKNEITDCHFIRRYADKGNNKELDNVYYFLDKDLLVHFDTKNRKVSFLFRNTSIEKVEEVMDSIKIFKELKRRSLKPEISVLVNTRMGLETKSLDITKPKLSIDDNYNSDFKDIHQTIVKRLSKKNDKGLVLLHGKPGTGKTSYIRYIIASVKKEVIFLPPNMASAITNPDLISLLIRSHNSIFVIEDAENIVVDREKNGASPVSALLNISDGLLSDCLNIQIICSFNTDISKVDSALLRKGRLIAKYEFKELETTKAQALSYKLGFDNIISHPMTLTEIYNQDEEDFTAQKQRRSIGFRAA